MRLGEGGVATPEIDRWKYALWRISSDVHPVRFLIYTCVSILSKGKSLAVRPFSNRLELNHPPSDA